MSRKEVLLKGTFILTITGLASRLIGFFYRIFMSRTFGEEGVGLYQLIFPILSLGIAFTSSGIQTAISRNVARSLSLGKEKESREILFTGLLCSFLLAIFTMLFLAPNAGWLASTVLKDARCAPLLCIAAYSLPFAAVHSCICGYFYGQKQTGIPALSQLLEQVVRVLSVFILCTIALRKGFSLSVSVAVIGLVLGEVCSCLYCMQKIQAVRYSPHTFLRHFRDLFTLAVPLTGSRILLGILQSVEAISIPLKLQAYGLSASDALSTYGVLTGMALPCILFPSALTSSVSVMLLPTVTEMQTQKGKQEMTSVVRTVFFSCFAMGLLCTAVFLLLGSFMGNTLFHSESAGEYIMTLAWICPFLYTNSTLISVINGLGDANCSFLINTAGLLLRILCIFFAIPVIGIRGYLWGLLASQLLITVLASLRLSRLFREL